jgi:DNA-binding MarR family transcriptional regulator
MAKTKREKTEQLALTIVRVNLAFRQFIQARFKSHNIDLTFEMLQVLGCLWQKDGINQQEIADLTVKDKASMTYLIDNLSRRQLGYRQEDSTDRRNKLIYLTTEGKKLRQIIHPWIEEMYAIAGKDMTIEMLNQAIDRLEAIKTRVTEKV